MGPSDHAQMVESIVTRFAAAVDDASGVQVAMAPGRVNLIGDHTDYNDGYVLPMTVDRGVYVAIRKRRDRRARVRSVQFDDTVDGQPGELDIPAPGSWSSYVVGVVEELHLRGLIDTGFDAVVDGNLKLGAGLSSSAALEVAMAIALQQIARFEMSPVDMVKLCQHVEHTYARVFCGIMDQFACRMGRQGHALLLDCRSLDSMDVPVELGDYRVVIVSSEIKRSLATSAYNKRRTECEEAVEHFQRHAPGVRSLRDVTVEMFDAYSKELPRVLRRRCRHVLSENRRTLAVADTLGAGRLNEMGPLMTESHVSLRDDFEVSCPELDVLVTLALETDGVLGSLMMGGGFGGCTVSVVHKHAVATLQDRLNADYTSRFGLTPKVFVLEGNLTAGPVRIVE